MDGQGVKTLVEAGASSVQIVPPKEIVGDGYKFLAVESLVQGGDGSLTRSYDLRPQPAKEIRPEKLVIHTLTGLVDYLKANRDVLTLGDLMVHVVDHENVYLVSRTGGAFHQRTYHVQAAFKQLIGTPAANFAFGHYYESETFNIALQALFQLTPERKALLDIVGNAQTFTGATVVDDGSAQQVRAAAGAHFGENVKLPNPVILRPYRTFRDVAQPASPFVVRVQRGAQDMPMLALFEADGGAWKLEAIANIAAFLRRALATVDLPDDTEPDADTPTLVALLA